MTDALTEEQEEEERLLERERSALIEAHSASPVLLLEYSKSSLTRTGLLYTILYKIDLVKYPG